MDIDLSSLSKKGQNNFLRFFMKKQPRIKFCCSIAILFLIFLLPIIYFTMVKSASPLIQYIIIAIPIYFTLLFLLGYRFKQKNVKNIGKFIEKNSENGLFHYCFECNKKVDKTEVKCPLCLHNLKLKYSEHKVTTITNKMSQNFILTIFIVIAFFAFIPLRMMWSNITFLKSSVTTVRVKEAELLAEKNFNLGQINYLRAVKQGKETLPNKVLGMKNNIPILPYFYTPSEIPVLYISYESSTEVTQKFCQNYNDSIDRMIEEKKKQSKLEKKPSLTHKNNQ